MRRFRSIGYHTLRHTFCSLLEIRGAPPRTIQELAGHASITTTMRYMHLSPACATNAITLLEAPSNENADRQRRKRCTNVRIPPRRALTPVGVLKSLANPA